MGSLEGNEGFGRADYFLVGKDFPSYIECQEKVDEAYRDQRVSLWTFFLFSNEFVSHTSCGVDELFMAACINPMILQA